MNVEADLEAVVVAVASLDDRRIAFAPWCLQPQVTLAPVRRGEGRGEGSVDESERFTSPGAPLTLTLSPEDGGEGTGDEDGRSTPLFRGDSSGARVRGAPTRVRRRNFKQLPPHPIPLPAD